MMRQPKIDTVINITPTLGFGGVKTRIKNIGTHLSHFEHQFCAIACGAVADELIAAEFTVHLLNRQSKIPPFTAVWALIREMRTQRPSISH
jgi:hypothetical protein